MKNWTRKYVPTESGIIILDHGNYINTQQRKLLEICKVLLIKSISCDNIIYVLLFQNQQFLCNILFYIVFKSLEIKYVIIQGICVPNFIQITLVSDNIKIFTILVGIEQYLPVGIVILKFMKFTLYSNFQLYYLLKQQQIMQIYRS